MNGGNAESLNTSRLRRPTFRGVHDLLRAVGHEPQLAVDGDELPALGDARLRLLDAERVNARRDLVPLAAREDVRERLLERLRRGRLAVGVAHARGQVVRADEDRVDAGHGEDLVGVPHRLDVLALEDDEDLVVGLRVVVGGGGGEVQGVDAAADAARLPRGGYRHAATASSASCRVFTIGTTTP